MTTTKINWMALRRKYYLANKDRMDKMTLCDIITEMSDIGLVPTPEQEPLDIVDDYTDCYENSDGNIVNKNDKVIWRNKY
jgi:hypothetical protein